uniref:putative reverse transcriptase/maturase n=1 Tax=Madagascaria erythrocladioides TaxID=753684 RepID=UPI001FCD2F15|nr:putative reverse transcriptase/maturase [Madagascaria erythrocladioides]UNJ16568.1 putative reverse transcriptase/maturase [Madagascaria erythrocladioides]
MRNLLIYSDQLKFYVANNLKLDPQESRTNNIWKKKCQFSRINSLTNHDYLILLLEDLSLQLLTKLSLEPEHGVILKKYKCYVYQQCLTNNFIVQQVYYCLKKSHKYIAHLNMLDHFMTLDINTWIKKINNNPLFKTQIIRWLKKGLIEEYCYQIKSYDCYPFKTTKNSFIATFLINLLFLEFESSIFCYLNATKQHLTIFRDEYSLLLLSSSKSTLFATCAHIQNFANSFNAKQYNKIDYYITYSQKSFDFLGYNFRSLETSGQKVVIKPSKQSIKLFNQKNREIIQQFKSGSISILIRKLKTNIIHWGLYYARFNRIKDFQKIDNLILSQLRAVVLRRHPSKSKSWIKSKYFPHKKRYYFFGKYYISSWVFTDAHLSSREFLPKLEWLKINSNHN